MDHSRSREYVVLATLGRRVIADIGPEAHYFLFDLLRVMYFNSTEV